MKDIKIEAKLCLICMEEHEVKTVEVKDEEIYKGLEVDFDALYEYCSHADEFLETEEMIKTNSLSMKDAYRKKVGLLTSNEIIDIRNKYGVSQKDFSDILGWGKATITRYENHQVQDRAHDDFLKKIASDPKWFLEMLERAKDNISEKAYLKYYNQAKIEYRNKQNQYLIDSIKSLYANYEDDSITGKARLNLDKVVDMVNYLALKVSNLHKVKLMKMLWYSDALHFKRNGSAISGLIYNALEMGAVPEGHDQIMLLDNISFESILYRDNIGYKFKPTPNFEIKNLTEKELETIDYIIEKFGTLNTNEIIHVMHKEDAYKFADLNCKIPFSFAENLSIN